MGGVLLAACNGGGMSETSFTTDPSEPTNAMTSTTEPADTTTDGPPLPTTTTAPDDTTTTTPVPTDPTGDPSSDPGSEPTATDSDPATSDETTITGDATTDDTSTGDAACEAPGLLIVCDKGDDVDPFHAMGLGCEGAPENTLKISDEKLVSKVVAYRVARGFGAAEDPDAPGELLFRPREGEKFLIVSTGQVTPPGDDGVVIESEPQYDNDNNFNADNPNALPAPMSPLEGSNNGQGGTPFLDCDGAGDCSDSISPNWLLGNQDPNDLLFGSFTITVPGGTYGFNFDLAYFSSEYPEFVGEKFNDMFIGWSTSEAYTGNVTFFDDQPFTVTALAEEMEQSGFIMDDPALEGTGFEGHGSTGWTTVSAPVVPGETFTFAFAIMDMGDSSKATAAVLDNWRWSCKGCVPIEVDPLCGTEGHPKCCGLCVEKADDPLCGTEGHPQCCAGE
jgi:hypothetical protein